MTDIHYIKQFEGYSPSIYYCSGNKPTIGYGHVIQPHEKFPTKITEQEAENILKDDLKKYEDAVNKYVKRPLTQLQFTALVFFVYNVGISAFKSSTLLRKLNDYNNKDYEQSVVDELRKWIYTKKRINKGLINRIEQEITIWKMGSKTLNK